MIPSSGLLVLNKPTGLTSFQCVHRLKPLLGTTRVGHCGTLDPMAEGVLVILFGSATRQQDRFLSMEKEYRFRARWGVMTDTGDRDGKETERFASEHIRREALESAALRFCGDQMQTPPAYAALKFKGKHYYDWARQGIAIPRVPRPIHVKTFEILNHDHEFWEARVICSRGTYIRTLAEDVARSLNSGTHLDALIRERIGEYQRADALPWSAVEAGETQTVFNYVQDPIHHHAGIL